MGMFYSNLHCCHHRRIARLFLHYVWRCYNLYNHMILDRGLQFVVLFIRELCHLLRVKIVSFIAQYLQSDKQIEQVNQELDQYFWTFVNKQQSDWYNFLVMVEFQHNNYIYSLIQQPLFLLDIRQLLQMCFELYQWESKPESVSKFMKRIKSILEKAKFTIQKFWDNMAKYCNQHCIYVLVFKHDDKMLLDSSDIHTTCFSTKLSHYLL